MASFLCSPKSFLFLLLLSAVPIAYIIHSETSPRSTHVYEYHSHGWFREGAKWDDLNRRFLVAFFEGGLGVIPVHQDPALTSLVLHEIPVVNHTVDLWKNASLGFAIDQTRKRVVAAVADVVGNRYSAVAAYDLSTWSRIFLTQLSGPEGGKTLADDVAIDTEGNAYITDAIGNKIWKVGVNGEFLHAIENPQFAPKQWYQTLVGLNGIVYHPNGYLLVAHTLSGNLFKIDTKQGSDEVVKLVNVTGGSLKLGDGMELLSPTRLVISGIPARLVESSDDWESCSVVGKFSGVNHRLPTAATVKDGKVYLSHLIGLGYPKRKHLLVEAVFES